MTISTQHQPTLRLTRNIVSCGDSLIRYHFILILLLFLHLALCSCTGLKPTEPRLIRHIFISNKAGTPVNPTSIHLTPTDRITITSLSSNEAAAYQIARDGAILWHYSRHNTFISQNSSRDYQASTPPVYNTQFIDSQSLSDGTTALCGSYTSNIHLHPIPLITHLDRQGTYIADTALDHIPGHPINNGKIIACIMAGKNLIIIASIVNNFTPELWFLSTTDLKHIFLIATSPLDDISLLNRTSTQHELTDSMSPSRVSILPWEISASAYYATGGDNIVVNVTDNASSALYVLTLSDRHVTVSAAHSHTILLVPTLNTDKIAIFFPHTASTKIDFLDTRLSLLKQIRTREAGIKFVWGGFIGVDNDLFLYGESGVGLLVKPVISHSVLAMNKFALRHIDIPEQTPGPFAQVGAYLSRDQYAVATPIGNEKPLNDGAVKHAHGSGCDITISSTQ